MDASFMLINNNIIVVDLLILLQPYVAVNPLFLTLSALCG